MKKSLKEGLKVVGVGSGGAAAGAAYVATFGGIGIAAFGTAVAAPIVAVGAGLSLTGYGLYKLGKQVGAGKKTSDNLDSEETDNQTE